MVAATDDPHAAATEAEQRGDIEGAIALYRAYAQGRPDDPWALATFGGQLLQHGRVDEAERVLLAALRRFPCSAPLLFNTGRVAQTRMRVDQAIGYFRLALAAQPGFAMARFILSTQLLLKGEYREGLLLFRARNELSAVPNAGWPRTLPRWEGEPLQGKHLLVWLDWGGLGDELQFARYLAPLARDYRPARLLLGCSREGQRLYERIEGVDEASSAMGGIEVDYQIAIIDLAIIYRTALDNMPPAQPYLRALPADVERLAQRTAGLRGRKIGLCWGSGFWGKTTRSEKAIPLENLACLSSLPNTEFISLQKGPAHAELPCPGLNVHDFDTDLHDMADTAALIENLDLVISVDTAVAHLAGALGKPVLMLLKWDSGNFWLLDREDSPWYPSMRIVRQRAPGDWQGVAAQVLEILSAPEPSPRSADGAI
jgi:tetratricopeptide (TPR) repeat protein